MNDLRRLFSLLAITLALASTGCGSDELTSPAGPANTLAVTPDKLVLGSGMARQLSAKVLDESGGEIPGVELNFVSSDPGRAAVSASGLVTYTGAGWAEIRISSSDLRTVVPYHGLGSGHPLGTPTTTARLPETVRRWALRRSGGCRGAHLHLADQQRKSGLQSLSEH